MQVLTVPKHYSATHYSIDISDPCHSFGNHSHRDKVSEKHKMCGEDWAVSSSWAADGRCSPSIPQHLWVVTQSAEPCLTSIAAWRKMLPLGQSHCHAPSMPHAFTGTPSHGEVSKMRQRGFSDGFDFIHSLYQTSLICKMSMLGNNTGSSPPTPPLPLFKDIKENRKFVSVKIVVVKMKNLRNNN